MTRALGFLGGLAWFACNIAYAALVAARDAIKLFIQGAVRELDWRREDETDHAGADRP